MLTNYRALVASLFLLTACAQDRFPYQKIENLTRESIGIAPQPSPTPHPTGTPPPAPLQQGLIIHPQNPHYFLDLESGRPLLIAEYSTLAPSSPSYVAANEIEVIRQNGGRYTRIWHLLPWERGTFWPWARSSTPGAPMGGNKYDFNLWDPVYWGRLNETLKIATESRITSEIHLFDRCGLSPASVDRYEGNPWASDNNINGLELPRANSDGTPEFYQYRLRPNLRAQQEKYVRKMIDETVSFNIIYEIENEHWELNDPDFADYYAQFVKNHIATHYPNHRRLISYSSLEDDLEAFYTRNSVDIVNKHFGNDVEDNPDLLNQYLEPRWRHNKPINIDEFANGVTSPDVLRKMVWIIVTSGGHFHIEDARDESNPWGVVNNLRTFIADSNWNFISASPNRSMSSGYCMQNPGTEYFCYFLPSKASKTLNGIPSGNYRVRWWNPRAGGWEKEEAVNSQGSLTITAPDKQDWALFIQRRN
ncbi:MAG: hypothetical protein IT289_11205 [Oligoflexia bacterium]|nr:hypothetical protein [Oligoflexia bacterium]